jgi:Mg-chelatase subunit ChlI
VLFLDELPEFDRRTLEALREPLETGAVAVSRVAMQAEYPAEFQLVAAMNPCPCGYHGDPGGRCECTPGKIAQYRARVSGPLLDRIDLRVEVPGLSPQEIKAEIPEGESSAQIAAKVHVARNRQLTSRWQTEFPAVDSGDRFVVPPGHSRASASSAKPGEARSVRSLIPPHPARRPYDCRPRIERFDPRITLQRRCSPKRGLD